MIFRLCDIDFGGTSEKKARALLSKTRFFSLRWPEATRIDIFEFLLHRQCNNFGLKPPRRTWVLILAASGSKNCSPSEYVFFWGLSRSEIKVFFDISCFLEVSDKECRVLRP